jgi:hypothetical protein
MFAWGAGWAGPPGGTIREDEVRPGGVSAHGNAPSPDVDDDATTVSTRLLPAPSLCDA